MKHCISILTIVATLIFTACSSDSGSSSAPDIPDNPEGSKTLVLEQGKSIHFDDTDNMIALDDRWRLNGDNLFFSTAGKRDGISYITRIPTAPWNKESDALQNGYGYIIGSKKEDGAVFTRLFVEKKDTASGSVKTRIETPFFGDGEKFYFNHKALFLSIEQGDTTVVLTKPTSYNVALASGEWASITPHITYILLNFSENSSGDVRTDTLIFTNDRFDEARIPVIQLDYSLKEDIIF